METKPGTRNSRKSTLLFWEPFVQLWIFAAVVTFFIVRVLGSQTAQHIVHGLRHRLHL